MPNKLVHSLWMTCLRCARRSGWWLGLVVPKRHAKRSVTRSLVKRQMRAVWRRSGCAADGWEPGMWVVRLRSPFDRKQFRAARRPMRCARRCATN